MKRIVSFPLDYSVYSVPIYGRERDVQNIGLTCMWENETVLKAKLFKQRQLTLAASEVVVERHKGLIEKQCKRKAMEGIGNDVGRGI